MMRASSLVATLGFAVRVGLWDSLARMSIHPIRSVREWFRGRRLVFDWRGFLFIAALAVAAYLREIARLR